MMIKLRVYIIGLILLIGVSACTSKDVQEYDGPEVTKIIVNKSDRVMQLMHNDVVLKTYDFELGFAPVGHKEYEGDGKTPEGEYKINRKNPNSQYHLSIGISYPNASDIAHAASLGKSPGGDIFIHGTPRAYWGDDDWTWGCIAVSNREMNRIYSMVNIGTPIVINP